MKHKLEAEYELTGQLFGLLSVQPPHTLCWQVNRFFNLKLRYAGEQQTLRKGVGASYAYYEYHSEASENHWYLVCNHDDGKTLVPELKKFDYLALVVACGELLDEQIISGLRSLPAIQGCYKFETTGIRNPENLIFE
jgi:hypothetical protein